MNPLLWTGVLLLLAVPLAGEAVAQGPFLRPSHLLLTGLSMLPFLAGWVAVVLARRDRLRVLVAAGFGCLLWGLALGQRGCGNPPDADCRKRLEAIREGLGRDPLPEGYETDPGAERQEPRVWETRLSDFRMEKPWFRPPVLSRGVLLADGSVVVVREEDFQAMRKAAGR